MSGCGGRGPVATPAVEPLVLGTLVPLNGSLRQFGAAESAGIALAVQQINAAGGVLGQQVVRVEGDSGDAYTNIASQTVDRELARKVTAIVGATGSSVTVEVVDKIVGAGVVLVSPADGADKLSGYPARGLYFRLVPPDAVQARALVVLLEQQNRRNVTLVHVRDLYGAGLAADLARDIVAGGGKVAASIEYDGQATEFTAVATAVAAAGGDAVVLVGDGQGHPIIQALTAAGVGPTSVPLFLTDLELSNIVAHSLPPGTMNGVQGVRAGAAPDSGFLSALGAVAPGLVDIGFAAQAYDAVMMTALAADAAGSTTGKAIATELRLVGTGTTSCTTYRACVELLTSGRTIAYRGASGPLPLGADGTVSSATIGEFRFGPGNSYPSTGTGYLTVTVP